MPEVVAVVKEAEEALVESFKDKIRTMKKSSNNYAFIDSQNLNLSIRALGWRLDFARFRLGKHKLEAVIVPNRCKFSALLKFKIFRSYLRFLNDLRNKLEYKKKSPP